METCIAVAVVYGDVDSTGEEQRYCDGGLEETVL